MENIQNSPHSAKFTKEYSKFSPNGDSSTVSTQLIK